MIDSVAAQVIPKKHLASGKDFSAPVGVLNLHVDDFMAHASMP